MNGGIGYAREKISLAIYILATAPGGIKKRLLSAFNECIAVQDDDFPEDLRGDWSWINNQMTKFGPVKDAQGTVLIGQCENTMRRIRNSTAVKIAEKLFALEDELRDREETT